MTTVEVERWFSMLKRKKHFLHIMMTQKQLTALVTQGTEINLVMSIADFNYKVTERFTFCLNKVH